MMVSITSLVLYIYLYSVCLGRTQALTTSAATSPTQTSLVANVTGAASLADCAVVVIEVSRDSTSSEVFLTVDGYVYIFICRSSKLGHTESTGPTYLHCIINYSLSRIKSCVNFYFIMSLC
jgi:hypothetical protein